MILFDVLTYEHTDNPQGLPVDWPSQCFLVRDGEPERGSPWFRVSESQLAAYKEQHQSSYDTWLTAQNESQEIREIKDKITQLRWDHETQGITIGTQPVSTLREEMPVWQGMLLDMTLQPGVRTAYEYKPRNGANVVLTVQQVQRCYQCFAWYVSACFATERYLYGLIDAGTPIEQVEAMLETVWPQTQFDWVAP
jgi:hypothetical protein